MRCRLARARRAGGIARSCASCRRGACAGARRDLAARLRKRLIRAGLLAGVNVALAVTPDLTRRAVIQAWFEFASEVRRDNPEVLALAQAVDLDTGQVDDALRAAAAP